MVMEFKDKKMQEPEDNMRYAEKKAVRMMNNGLNNQDDSNLIKKENRFGNTTTIAKYEYNVPKLYEQQEIIWG